MRKMTITEALVALKLYDSKINKAIERAEFVSADKAKSKNVGAVTKEDFNKKAKADYQSVTDLIENRAAIKSAIARSNAVTTVTINDKTMTVAEAIERKNSIQYDRNLLAAMERQFTKATQTVNRKNADLDDKVIQTLNIMAGGEGTLTKEAQKATEETFRQNNEYALVDPIDIQKKIEVLRDEIDGFVSGVDVALSVSNATTFIEV